MVLSTFFENFDDMKNLIQTFETESSTGGGGFQSKTNKSEVKVLV